ncbi:cobalt-precorrin-5B (C(1))-methyltransferase [Aureimonas sp. ME7]|uniref:cobalt-precorrin-5B (C(1))-methyltransferase n=1 Tax=Aureimonas sp. ME7 TaxID=2744252 RepID=UPI0015F6B886|nr:cobalt-precorrin-5B (C(1))-methyltransferase [Aureimonas sp. ME7]
MGVDLGQRRTKSQEARDGVPLRRGWTTGACATAATKAALGALLTGRFEDPVTIRLPKGETPAFALNRTRLDGPQAFAAIVKDAGDDPDVTHLAEIGARVRFGAAGSGIVFQAGPGVGTVTKPGLPIPPGEPAINPVPRAMMREVVEALCAEHGLTPDVEIAIEVADGERLAALTWNPRLGILGGLSILGTTGIVHPFSCSAWIHSIHRGIDVARACRLSRVVGATGSASEAAARRLYPALPEIAYLDMGDFAGGVLKYLRRHPVPHLTLAGGFAKFTKLAQGSLDLHSGRSQVDLAFLLERVRSIDAAAAGTLEARILGANTAKEVLDIASERGIDLAASVATGALETAREAVGKAPCRIEVVVTDRSGEVIARAE